MLRYNIVHDSCIGNKIEKNITIDSDVAECYNLKINKALNFHIKTFIGLMNDALKNANTSSIDDQLIQSIKKECEIAAEYKCQSIGSALDEVKEQNAILKSEINDMIKSNADKELNYKLEIHKLQSTIENGSLFAESSANERIIALMKEKEDIYKQMNEMRSNYDADLLELNAKINKLEGIDNNSSKKGKASEIKMCEYLESTLDASKYEVYNVGSIKQICDILIRDTRNNNAILIDNKNYKDAVRKSELDKFNRDIKEPNIDDFKEKFSFSPAVCGGILASERSRIAGYPNSAITFKIINSKPVFYIDYASQLSLIPVFIDMLFNIIDNRSLMDTYSTDGYVEKVNGIIAKIHAENASYNRVKKMIDDLNDENEGRMLRITDICNELEAVFDNILPSDARILCKCGQIIRKCDKERHESSKKHKKAINDRIHIIEIDE